MAVLLLIILSNSYFTFTVGVKEYVVDLMIDKCAHVPEVKKIPDISVYKKQEMEPKPIRMQISTEHSLSSIDRDLNISIIPEIDNINVAELLQEKFSEEQQKEYLRKLNKLNAEEVISEEDFTEPEAMSEKDLKNKVFDSDIVLRNIHGQDNICDVLKHPLVRARLDRFEKYFKYKREKAWRTGKINKYNKALHFVELLRSQEVEELINKIYYTDFATANKASVQLRKLFSWNGQYIYDQVYPVKLLGIDLLACVDDVFKTRGDFILNNMGQTSLKEIGEFSELCDTLQRKNDVATLADLYTRLKHKMELNEIRNRIDEICYAIVERALLDPMNIILGDIKYGSFDTARAALDSLEKQIEPTSVTRIISDEEYFRKSLMHRSKSSRLEIAQNLYKARPDYAVLPNNQGTLNPIVEEQSIDASAVGKNTVELSSEYQNTQVADFTPNVEEKVVSSAEQNLPIPFEKKETLSIQDNDLDTLFTNSLQKFNNTRDTNTFERVTNRINAINQTRSNDRKLFDYSSRITPLSGNGPTPKEFQNTYGTELDYQLHQELSYVRNTMGHLEQAYPGNRHIEALAPMVYDYTIQAKCEQSVLLAFELTDLCHTITQVLENGMHVLYDASTSVGKGVWSGVNNFASIQHWKDMATGMVTGPAQLGLLFIDVMSRVDDLDYAMVEILTKHNSDAFLVEEEKYRTRMQNQHNAINECVQKIKEMPWQEVVEHGSEIGTTMTLDMLAFHAATGFATKAGNLVIEELTSAVESGAIFTEEYAVQVAGVGKLMIEEGAEVSTIANQAVKVENAIKDVSGVGKVVCNTAIESIFLKDLKLIGDNIWQSPAGIIYGKDRKFGNTINHMLAHMTPNSMKKNHTVFNISKDKIMNLIDEAWVLKTEPLLSDTRAYVVDMKRVVGTNGETAIRIVVQEPGTNKLITAYPVIAEGKL